MEDHFLNSGTSKVSIGICISIRINIGIGTSLGIRGSGTFVSVRVLVWMLVFFC